MRTAAQMNSRRFTTASSGECDICCMDSLRHGDTRCPRCKEKAVPCTVCGESGRVPWRPGTVKPTKRCAECFGVGMVLPE